MKRRIRFRNPFKEILNSEGKLALFFIITLLAGTLFLLVGAAFAVSTNPWGITGVSLLTFMLFAELKVFVWDYAIQTKLPEEGRD